MSYLFETKNLNYGGFINYDNFSIELGKVAFITGESGSGKSTLFKLFNGTLPINKGEIIYKGKNIEELDTINLRKEILLISQEVYLFEGSILNNFKKFYEYRGCTCLNDELIKNFLKVCVLDFDLNKDVLTMSGGERQRLYIAVFLSFLPKVILLDEPTSALDSKNSINLLENIINFCKNNGIDIIIISHDQELVQNFSDKIIVLQKGGI